MQLISNVIGCLWEGVKVGMAVKVLFEDVTPEDAAVLILSVLLHDCAMHLSESAFVALLSDPWRDRSLPRMDDPSWTILWEEFLGEASRFDGRKLKSLFGDSQRSR